MEESGIFFGNIQLQTSILHITIYYSLRQILFDVRAGNSDLAKSLVKNVTM